VIYIRVCPKCKEEFKYGIMKIIFLSPFYKLKCDKCNTKLRVSKKINNINSTLTFIPLIFIVLFSSDILDFFTRFTNNSDVSFWICIFICVVWGTIINNFNFPWIKYEEKN